MAISKKLDWLIPAGLTSLTVIPVLGGALRLAEVFHRGTVVTVDNARFLAAPAPAVLHIVMALVFGILGAFQFSPGFRAKRPRWHRVSGRVLVVCGLVAGLSALWLTQFYPHVKSDGPSLYFMRLAAATAMVVSIALGLAAIRKRDFTAHRAWMIRGYAIAMGAGTQVFTHLPWFVFVGKPSGSTRDLLMGSGWLINIVVAEWILRPRSAGSVGDAGDRQV